MKNKEVGSTSKNKKNTADSNAITVDKQKKSTGVNSDTITSAIAKVKVKAGRGLANEGTLVSYEEER